MVITLMALAFFGKGFGALGWPVISDVAPKEIVGLCGGVFNVFGNVAILPAILVKSVLLALVAGYMADRFRKITIPALLGTVMAYQVVGTLIEWVLVGDFYLAAQDFRIGIPGMLLQIFGGYALLKAIAKR